jgi:hypothetical protein
MPAKFAKAVANNLLAPGRMSEIRSAETEEELPAQFAEAFVNNLRTPLKSSARQSKILNKQLDKVSPLDEKMSTCFAAAGWQQESGGRCVLRRQQKKTP